MFEGELGCGKNRLGADVDGLFACVGGCKKQVDQAGFISAINKSFGGQAECVWPHHQTAAQAIDKRREVRAFDALGCRPFHSCVGGKERPGCPEVVNKYDSPTRDTCLDSRSQPAGYGNFCFGHFNVTAIDKAVPNAPSTPRNNTVNYRYEVEEHPDWAAPRIDETFRKIAADTSIQYYATLVKALTEAGRRSSQAGK